MPRSASDLTLPEPSAPLSTLETADWIERVVPSPVSGLAFLVSSGSLGLYAVRPLIVVCSAL